jgi:hypothetical protein
MLQISGGQGTPVIAGISYVFPSCTRSVRELAQASMLESSADTLESCGFSGGHLGTTQTP